MMRFWRWMQFVLLGLGGFLAQIPGAMAQPAAVGGEGKPDLYYLVVDRSGSIDQKLANRITLAVGDYVRQIPEGSELRVVFFNHLRGPEATWSPVGAGTKREFDDWFAGNFRPGGDTHLYDTVAGVFEELGREGNRYGRISVIILSDGGDDPGDDPATKQKRPTRYKSWPPVEQMAGGLKKSHPHFFAVWYTLGFEPKPKDRLSAGSPIATEARPKEGPIEIKGPPPVKPSAAFNASPTTVEIGKEVLFALASDRGVESCRWDFGDRSGSTEKQPRHAYAQAGAYSVTARVSGPGGSDANTQPNLITVKAEVSLRAQFEWAPPEARAGESVTLISKSEGHPESAEWEIQGVGKRSGATAPVKFDEAGEHNVTLVVRRGGKQDQVTRAIKVGVRRDDELLAIPSFKAEPTKGKVPLSVRFQDTTQGKAVKWHWDFGDSGTSEERNPVHTYEKEGNFAPRLTVTNLQGKETTSQADVAISVQAPPAPWPLWLWVLIGAIAALLAWVGVIVPLLNLCIGLSSLRKPAATLVPVGGVGQPLHRLARKGGVGRFFWPKTSVGIGHGKACEIRMAGGSSRDKPLARLGRVPFTRDFRLAPKRKETVFRLEQVSDLTTGQTRTERRAVNSPIRLSRKAADFEIDGNGYHWTVG